jgi:Acyltransferase family
VKTGLILGLCLPASCTRQKIATLIGNITEIKHLTTDHLHCSNDRNNEKDSHLLGTIVFAVTLSILFLIVSIGTAIDLRAHIYHVLKTNEISDETSHKNASITSQRPTSSVWVKNEPLIIFLGEFSAIRTLRRIFKIAEVPNSNMFKFLNGIRVLSLLWVIIGHSFSSGIYYAANILDMQTARRNIIMHLITSGALAVDTFFLLGGFLTSVLFVRQLQKQSISVRLMAHYYIHRYLRLTPTFILTMFVSIYLTPYFGHGPLYPTVQGFEPEQCRNGNWWTSFLYIGNFLKSSDLCLGITWYLHNDMQFHLIAPLALIPFVIGKKSIGYLVTILLVLISIGSTISIILYYPSVMNSITGIATNDVSESLKIDR